MVFVQPVYLFSTELREAAGFSKLLTAESGVAGCGVRCSSR